MTNYTGEFSVTPQYQNKPDPRYGPLDERPRPPAGYPCSDPSCGQCAKFREQEIAWQARNYPKPRKEAKMNDDPMTAGTMPSDTVEARGLYEITTVYGEDRNDVKLITEHVVAESASRAQLKKKPVPADWDMDYVTVICKSIGTVRVKAKPREILASK